MGKLKTRYEHVRLHYTGKHERQARNVHESIGGRNGPIGLYIDEFDE